MALEYAKTPYFHIGRASDLKGRDKLTYRLLEILPGFLSWLTIGGIFVLSYFTPVIAAYFIIAFDLYWLLKTIYLSVHLRYNWKRLRHNIKTDWLKKLENFKYKHIHQLVILPYYKEGEDVVSKSLNAILISRYNKQKMSIVLGVEERAGEEALEIANKMKKRYADKFANFLITVHPKDVEGEMAGKGSNIAYAAEESRKSILDPGGLDYKDVIVSAFDIDTVVYPDYFLCVTWHFLNEERPHKVSYQPVPLYNNNIWYAPALSRVVATSSTFWQMVQQERPEKLATFSSHSLSFKALHDVGYWQKNMVSEDSRIYWNLYLAHDGDYGVVPISYPVSMDANLDVSFWKTTKNIYKQHRRWTWGVENIPYILFGFIKNKSIPLKKKVYTSIIQLEGFWSLATNPIMIFLLGWMPLILGGRAFNATVLSYKLPFVTRNLMALAMAGLIFSAIISFKLLPTPPSDISFKKRASMLLQWILVPVTITIFGAIPGLDAQTRLMFGKYMGFWVTPKHREEGK